ncbi:MAG: RNA-binding S4 domain-containing protein [Bacillota bacterium]
MRIDKFLKVSRLIKRRTLAKEICDRGQVTLNERVAKASAEVKPGDVITINLGSRQLKVEVCDLRANVPAKMAAGLYRVLEDRRIANADKD